MRHVASLTLSALVLSLTVVACGDDGSETDGSTSGNQEPNGEVNPQSARGNATTAIQGSNTAISGDGVAAAYQLAGLGTSALGLVGPSTAGQGTPSGLGTTKQAEQTGVCECDATSCHFEACSDDTSPNAFTIDGDISWANGNVVADLTYAGTAQTATYDFHVVMNVTVTADSIDGTVTSDGSVETSGVSTTWESSITMNEVTFNTAACPVSGSIDVDASVTYSGAQSYSGETTITLDGSGC